MFNGINFWSCLLLPIWFLVIGLMQNLIKPHGNETWGESIKHLEILDVQPHVLSNLKLNMFSYFVGMFLISLLSLLQELLRSGVFFFMPLDHSITSLK